MCRTVADLGFICFEAPDGSHERCSGRKWNGGSSNANRVLPWCYFTNRNGSSFHKGKQQGCFALVRLSSGVLHTKHVCSHCRSMGCAWVKCKEVCHEVLCAIASIPYTSKSRCALKLFQSPERIEVESVRGPSYQIRDIYSTRRQGAHSVF